MKTFYEYRAQAREALQNRWGEAAIVSLIILVAAMVISIPSFMAEWAGSITTVLSVLILPLQYAYYISLLERTRGGEEELTRFTLQYAINHAYANTRFLVAGLLIMLISMVLAIFTLGIGAIIVNYMYSMVPYLLHDYPELTPREAMKISREMMSGQKWNLFVLDLTFIGWILLSILTAGIGMIFVEPYMSTTRAAYYEDLKSEKLVEETEEPTSTTAE
ncbi:MAG: DUF975 family protein [Bacteroidales bacterium]|nr:DUF975 family protein [Bacteroidales bacterium]